MRLVRVLVVLILSSLSLANPAYADEIATVVVPQPNAPLTLSRCNLSIVGGSLNMAGYNPSFNLFNRAAHAMIDASVEYRFYDRDNAQIGQTSYTYTPANTLSPQDTGSYNNNNAFYVNLSEPISAVSRITCKLVGAHFTGRLSWKPDTTWHGGPLSPSPKPAADGDSSYQPSPDSATGTVVSHASAIKFDVTSAWNDVTPQGLFVHDSLLIHGGDNPATLRPSNFSLTMNLAAGAQKTYQGFTAPAPSYQKYNAFTKTYALAYEIDPQTDFGRLGSIIVPAHGVVAITVTFAIADQVAEPTDNRNVSIR